MKIMKKIVKLIIFIFLAIGFYNNYGEALIHMDGAILKNILPEGIQMLGVSNVFFTKVFSAFISLLFVYFGVWSILKDIIRFIRKEEPRGIGYKYPLSMFANLFMFFILYLLVLTPRALYIFTINKNPDYYIKTKWFLDNYPSIIMVILLLLYIVSRYKIINYLKFFFQFK